MSKTFCLRYYRNGYVDSTCASHYTEASVDVSRLVNFMRVVEDQVGVQADCVCIVYLCVS